MLKELGIYLSATFDPSASYQRFSLLPAGLEEWPRVVPITREYGRAHAEALTAMDAKEEVWQEEGVWAEGRWSMEVRPSTGTPLKELFELSFAVEGPSGDPVAYIYTTHGQPDYPVARSFPGIFIFRLSVHKDHKGKRLGPLLLLASARAAKEKGIGPYVTLETDEKNQHARHVYESLGFEAKGTRVDEKKPTVTFVEYAAPIDTVIERAQALVSQRYGPEAEPIPGTPAGPPGAGLEEGVAVKAVEELEKEAPELAAEVRAAGKTHAVLLPDEALEEALEELPEALFYGQESVLAGAWAIVSDLLTFRGSWKLPSNDLDVSNRLLQEAAQQSTQGKTVVIALNPEEQAGLNLPSNHSLVLLVRPATWPSLLSQKRVLAACLAQTNKLTGLILDLTSGTIRKVEISGRQYYVILATQV
ncbi:MAG: GNAT family N-acetyltransferase [Candidatus Omnitrophica bacterium]|nr:GNAT family N-acetyltransferase [Candidatus Omnitrophota bacterium]